MLEVTDTTT